MAEKNMLVWLAIGAAVLYFVSQNQTGAAASGGGAGGDQGGDQGGDAGTAGDGGTAGQGGTSGT